MSFRATPWHLMKTSLLHKTLMEEAGGFPPHTAILYSVPPVLGCISNLRDLISRVNLRLYY